MIRRFTHWSCAAVTVCLATSATGAAQSIAYALPDHAAATPQRTAPKKTVSVTFNNTALPAALREIAEQSATPFLFGNDVLKHSGTVTVTLRGVAVHDALDTILRGTGIGYTQNANGQLVFSKAKDAQSQIASGYVSGKITSGKTHAALAGASVSALVAGTTRAVTTGSDGSFRLELPAGEYTLTIRMVGYQRQMKSVTVTENQTVTIDVSLALSASVLDEVIVTGTVTATERRAIPNPITVITAEEIEKRGITRIEQFFRGEVPGVIAMDPGAERYTAQAVGAMARTDIYVRGSSTLYGSSNPMKTYIDGVEMLDPSYLGTIDPVSIERIEIITGPQAATIYGSSAMGGVMQIFTKKGTGASAIDMTVSTRYGMLESNLSDGRTPSHAHALTITGSTGPELSYSGNASYNYSGQWMPHLFSRRYGGSIGVTSQQGNLTATGTVSLTSGRNGTNNDIEGLLLSARTEPRLVNLSSVSYSSGSVGTSLSTSMSLNLDYRINPVWQHHLTVGRTSARFRIVPEAPRIKYPSDTLFRFRNSDNSSITANYNTSFIAPIIRGVSQVLTVGLSGSSGESMETNGCSRFRETPTYIDCGTSPFGGDVYYMSVRQTLNSSRWGGFGQWRVGFLDRLFLTLGVRGEKNRLYGSDHKIDWTPTNGITYTQDFGPVTVKLLGSYGKSTRDPSEADRGEVIRSGATAYNPSRWISQFANPNLTPEYSSGPQGGVEIYVGTLGSITINHYRQKTRDLIETVHIDSFEATRVSNGSTLWIKQGQRKNTASIKQYGWEATGSINLGPVSVRGTHSWNESRIQSQSAANRPGWSNISFKGIPTHTTNVRVTYAARGTSVSLNSNIVGAYVSRLGADGPGLMESQHTRFRWYNASQSYLIYWDWRRPRAIVSDVNIRHQIAPWITGTVNITNVGNSYANDASKLTPSLGRQTLIGASLRFPR